MNPDPDPRKTIVLDTNVVLDWLLFHDPASAALQAALRGKGLRWVATSAMRDELASVLAGGRFDRWCLDTKPLWTGWEQHCEELPTPQALGAAGRFRCTDPDDQKFIDLAVACGACWLVSRDRAVLKLARRLRAAGVAVIQPSAWVAPNPEQ